MRVLFKPTNAIQRKYMGISRIKKKHNSFNIDDFKRHAIEAYGNLENPKYTFTHQFFEHSKYPEFLEYLRSNFHVVEDTEPNTDVSYGYIVWIEGKQHLLRLSLVGPYFYVSVILPDGSQQEPQEILPEEDVSLCLRKEAISRGYIFTPKDVLNKKIRFGGKLATLYSIIFTYEDEPVWVCK